jgi:hypothetical protein
MPIDYSKYPPNWKDEIVPSILSRARNRCEQCGLKNHSTAWSLCLLVKDDEGNYVSRRIWFRIKRDAMRECRGEFARVEAVKVVLTVAHLDHDEENHDVKMNRLKALCQVCHLRYDAKEKYRRQVEKWKKV